MTLADELREAPRALAAQAAALAGPVAELASRLRARPPQLVATCARGSSAHAATFAKYLIEFHLGLPVAALAPSIASVYRRRLRLDGQLFLAVSQSGRSDDLVETARMAKAAGAETAALVNDARSPLAAACDVVLPIAAGPERGIAATKSFVASLAALLRLVAAWASDRSLCAALDRLPERLTAAAEIDWTAAALGPFAAAANLAVIGRGPTLAIARETALKLQEVADLPAHGFSGAEFLHGPVALVGPRYPVLVLMPQDEAAAGLRRLARDLEAKGAAVFVAAPDGTLPVIATGHPATDAVCLTQSFYALLPGLAARRGLDPERPRHLQKVTRTL